MNYNFTTSVSYLNTDTDDLISAYREEWNNKENVISVEENVVETKEGHISGIVTFQITPEKEQSIFSKISKLITNLSLIGECWTLTDGSGYIVATEENVDLI